MLLLHLTDPHLFQDPEATLKGVDTFATLMSVLHTARAIHGRAAAMVLTGDLSQDERPGSYARLAWALEGMPWPAYLLKGNHDDADAMWVGLTRQPADIRADRQFFLDNWQVLLLDSVVPGRVDGTLSAATLGWLERALNAHPRHHALICLHHHPVPVGSAWMDALMLDNGADLFAVTSRHPNVRAVLWGHVHQCFDGERGGVRLLSSPSTGVQFAPGHDSFTLDARAPGYRWLELLADGTLDTGVCRVPDGPVPVPEPGERLVRR